MNCKDKMRQLQVINYFNFDGPLYEDEGRNTDYSVAKAIRTFIEKYKSEIRQNYTFIIDYQNDIFSLLAYKIIKSSSSVVGKDYDIRYCGKLKTEEEKAYFKNERPIGIKKAQKLKKAVLITGFHPICNVIDLNYFSKFFIEIYNPLEHFTPQCLSILQDYYTDKEKDKAIIIENLGERDVKEKFWFDYFSYPMKYPDTLDIIRVNVKMEKDNLVPPYVCFTLSGTEQDFPLYDFILKSSKEGNIHLYIIPEDKVDFVKTNLSPYLDFRNQINDLNLITKEEAKVFIDECEEFYLYNYLTYKEEDNEN